ncbi:MAG: hypothetical protein KDA84_05650, partial [Planctomycetaceae bacterium]|nr:hypothetical protein [Planctomycetaceae bacterium]
MMSEQTVLQSSHQVDSALVALKDRLVSLDHRLQLIATQAGTAESSEFGSLLGVTLSPQDAEHALQRIAQARGEELHPADEFPEDMGDVLTHLTLRFQLSSLENWLVLVALAPELDRRYETVYAFLQDDVSQRFPTVNLAMQLAAGDSLQTALLARSVFAKEATLRRCGLIELFDPTDSGRASLLSLGYRLSPEVLHFLVGTSNVETAESVPRPELEQVLIRAEQLAREEPTLFLIQSPSAEHARQFSALLAARLGWELTCEEPLRGALHGVALSCDANAFTGKESEWKLWQELAWRSAQTAFVNGILPGPLLKAWRAVEIELPAPRFHPGRVQLSPRESELAQVMAKARAIWNASDVTSAALHAARQQLAGRQLATLELGQK